MIIKVSGDIIGNDWKEIYDWFGLDSTCPRDIEKAIADLPAGEKLEIEINSGGGDVFAGQEIYSLLRERNDVEIEIQSLAASAASVIAMAGPCRISPVGLIMIHNVSVNGASGDHGDMAKMADMLKRMDEALAAAYVYKTGMPLDEVLKLMDKETWLTADRAIELGFADGISDPGAVRMAAGFGRMAVTEDMIAEYKAAKKLEAEKLELLKDLDDYGV